MLQTTIRTYREKAGLTQQQLADAVEVRRETISHLEKGRYNPSLVLAFQISRCLGIPIETLFLYE